MTKYVLIFSLPLINSCKVEEFSLQDSYGTDYTLDTKVEEQVDLLFHAYILKHQIELAPEELIGIYVRSGGSYFSEGLEIKANNIYRLSSLDCFGKSMEKGKWMLEGDTLRMDGRGKLDMNMVLIEKEGKVYLVDPKAVKRLTTIAVALYEAEDGKPLELVIQEMEEIINADLFEKKESSK